MTTKKEATSRILEVGPQVRYVAILDGNRLQMLTRDEGASDSSSAESDRYEELLVNPTLLTMAQRRGAIDCGGLDFLLVGYGNFRQLVVPIPNGHVSVALESEAVYIDGLDDVAGIVSSMLE